jgi:hypothetical protein
LAAILVRDVLGLWGHLDLSKIKSSWPAVRAAMMAELQSAFRQSALSAQDFYTMSRELAGITQDLPRFDNTSPALNLPVASQVLDMTGPGRLLHDIKQGQPLQQAFQRGGVNLAGAMSRMALSAGRGVVLDTVKADPKAIAWARITSGNPCYFCAMLASRGAVYKTAQSAGFEAHNHCACTAAPVFRKQDVKSLTSKDLAQEWQRATRGLSGKAAIKAWRKYWDNKGSLQLGQ